MKKSVKYFWPMILSLTLLLGGCGEFNPAVLPSGRPSDGTETAPPVVTDEEGNVDENPFTVTLTVDGQVYIPSEEQPISVQWNDGYSIHTAPIGSDGVARVGGLDGDYRIRLTAIPEGYAYNPNVYLFRVQLSKQRLIRTHVVVFCQQLQEIHCAGVVGIILPNLHHCHTSQVLIE